MRKEVLEHVVSVLEWYGDTASGREQENAEMNEEALRILSRGTQSIRRPPLHENFELPTREELLAVKAGDNVKVIFEGAEGAERMWVKVTACEQGALWEGELDNAPLFLPLNVGDAITFHPYDVINILPR